jgi:hypothetical protein
LLGLFKGTFKISELASQEQRNLECPLYYDDNFRA